MTLQGLEITGGHTTETGSYGYAGRGAGINATFADLTIVACTVSDNTTAGGGAFGGGLP